MSKPILSEAEERAQLIADIAARLRYWDRTRLCDAPEGDRRALPPVPDQDEKTGKI